MGSSTKCQHGALISLYRENIPLNPSEEQLTCQKRSCSVTATHGGVSSLPPQTLPWPECMLYNSLVNQLPQSGSSKDVLERHFPLLNERIASEVLSSKTILISTHENKFNLEDIIFLKTMTEQKRLCFQI